MVDGVEEERARSLHYGYFSVLVLDLEVLILPGKMSRQWLHQLVHRRNVMQWPMSKS